MNVIFGGDPVEDMEVAKRLIGDHPNINFADLISVAVDRNQPVSARIAAIYTLGFTDDEGVSISALSRIVSDPDEPDDVKEHATEALDNM